MVSAAAACWALAADGTAPATNSASSDVAAVREPFLTLGMRVSELENVSGIAKDRGDLVEGELDRGEVGRVARVCGDLRA